MRSTPLLQDTATPSARLSELGFGCAAIGGRVARKEALLALNAAYDAGVTLYDTARSYGYGQSETVVGEFMQGRRDKIVLCTKFGILPPAKGGWKQKMKPLARTALKFFPGLRKAVQAQVGDQFLKKQFTLEVLKASFEASLRELKTDYVDMLLMHNASPESVDLDEIMEALDRLVTEGKVRMAGFSGDHAAMAAYFAKKPPVLKTAQFALNLATMSFTEQTRLHPELLLVANHPFGGSLGAAAGTATIETMRASATVPQTLKDKLDPADPQVLPEIVLNSILRGTGVSAVIPAMMKPHHIQSNVRAVEQCRFTDEELALLRATAIAG